MNAKGELIEEAPSYRVTLELTRAEKVTLDWLCSGTVVCGSLNPQIQVHLDKNPHAVAHPGILHSILRSIRSAL